jgi:ABC-2 type transport system permease protein
LLQEQLSQDYTVEAVDLTTGRVPGDVDVLVVVAPQGMTDQERFAIDQYLMRGGAVVVAAGNYALAQQQLPGGLSVEQLQENLDEMLASYGVSVGETMVLDPQNEPFPVQTQRTAGGMQVIEIEEVDYPFFVDVRADGMSEDHPIVSNLPAITLHWVSPLSLDEAAQDGRDVEVLLESTDDAWLLARIDVQPNTQLYPEYGFPVEGERASRPLAVAMRGTFESFFTDQPSPFEDAGTVTETVAPPAGVVEVSPETARLVVVGSNEFIDDVMLDLSRSLSADRYLNNLQFMQNAVDWLAEDEDLLTIRSGGTYARLLEPMEPEQQSVWEIANYGVALVALVAIGVVWQVRRRSEEPMMLEEPSVEEEVSDD